MTKPLNIGQVLVERLKKFTENMDSKPWTTLLGKPQGNESVDGNDIVREVKLHQFRILWSFDNNKSAEANFKEWLLENQEY